MLEALGISASQQELYELLLSSAPVKQDRLHKLTAARPWAGRLDAMMTALEELGLVAQHPGAEPQYVVVSPAAALDTLIAARQHALEDARQRILRLANRFEDAVPGQHPTDRVEIVYGRESIYQRWVEIQRTARHEVCCFDAPPYSDDPTVVNELEIELLRQGVTYRVLYDRQALEQLGRLTDVESAVAAGELARAGAVPMKLVLSDAPLALVPLHRDVGHMDASLLVCDPVLVDALRALFDMCWERAIPLGVRASSPASTDEPNATERQLLPLLAAGMTDREIAVHLSRHERTIRGYVQKMLARLGCTTRFQAGYEAIRRGWLSDVEVNVDDRA